MKVLCEKMTYADALKYVESHPNYRLAKYEEVRDKDINCWLSFELMMGRRIIACIEGTKTPVNMIFKLQVALIKEI